LESKIINSTELYKCQVCTWQMARAFRREYKSKL
jgi:hypothetical protein